MTVATAPKVNRFDTPQSVTDRGKTDAAAGPFECVAFRSNANKQFTFCYVMPVFVGPSGRAV